MRIAIAVTVALLATTPAWAQSNVNVPSNGTFTTVETQPGGAVTAYYDLSVARTACTAAGGTFSSANGKFVCNNPTTPLKSNTTPSPARTRTPPATPAPTPKPAG